MNNSNNYCKEVLVIPIIFLPTFPSFSGFQRFLLDLEKLWILEYIFTTDQHFQKFKICFICEVQKALRNVYSSNSFNKYLFDIYYSPGIKLKLFATPWTVAHQTPLSVGSSRQEYWSGLPGDLPDSGTEPGSPELQADSLQSESPRKPLYFQTAY